MTSLATVMSKPVSRGHAVDAAAEADDDVAQRAVVQVDDAAPRDRVGVDVERVAVEDVVVDVGGEQVVRHGHGVHVAGQVQVEVLHRHRPASSRRPPRRP